MKTKIILTLFTFAALSSCIKDFYGSSADSGKVELSAENFLYEGDLERIYLNEEIAALDIKIKDTSGDEQEGLLKQRAELKERAAEIIDLSSVGIEIIGPCNLPNRKCVPVALEYFVSSTQFSEMTTIVSNIDGTKKLTSAELSPLPNFETKLQYIRLPVLDFGEQIIVQITKKDVQGVKTTYSITLGK